MFDRTLRIGTRTSLLALRQVEEVLGHLRGLCPKMSFVAIGIDTLGDKDKITPISELEGTDFFTREIDEALLRSDIDFAVHSAKDLPDEIPRGLVLAAITKSPYPYDVLVSKNNLRIDQLPYAAKIGASSQRRKMQLKSYRNDFNIVDIRGNIHERIKRLYEAGLDAIVVAGCALMRLGLEHLITERISPEILKPHLLQGCLAIVARKDDSDLIKLLSRIDAREAVTLWK